MNLEINRLFYIYVYFHVFTLYKLIDLILHIVILLFFNIFFFNKTIDIIYPHLLVYAFKCNFANLRSFASIIRKS